jgi:RNA polymerase sigma-70 factor (ECF subfamily)
MDQFTRCLALHVPRLRRYTRALAGNGAEIDDLVQDSLERARRHTRQWRAGEAMRPFCGWRSPCNTNSTPGRPQPRGS